MTGQGPNNQPGFPDRTRQQRPKFNFNSRDVKSDITPDFMAAQLASFGSSAKLKSLPNSPGQANQPPVQQQDISRPHQMMQMGFGPGFPQTNQGFRQPMMAQMPYQGAGQAYMQPQMQFGMTTQFNMAAPGSTFNMTGPSQVPQGMSFGMPVATQPTSSTRQGTCDNMFNNFNQPTSSSQFPTSTSNDPFSNLRSSTNAAKPQSSTNKSFCSSSGVSAQSNITSQGLDAFDSKPFAATFNTSNHGTQSAMFSDFEALSGFPSKGSTSGSPSVPAPSTSKPLATHASSTSALKSGDFTAFDSMFNPSSSVPVSGFDNVFNAQASSTGFDSMFSSSTPGQVPPAPHFESSFNPTPAVSKPAAPFGMFPSVQPAATKPAATFDNAFPRPAAAKPATTFDSVFSSSSSTTPQAGPGFDSSFEPLPAAAPISLPRPTSASSASAKMFNAFDDDFTALSSKPGSQIILTNDSKPTVTDSFGQMPFTAPPATTELFNQQSGQGANVSVPAMPSRPAKPPATAQPVDLFNSAPFPAKISSSKPAVSTLPLAVDLFSTSSQSQSSASVVDKYSVFNDLSTDSTAEPPKPGYSTPISKPAKMKPEVPVQAFQGPDMFGDSFDPFNEKTGNFGAISAVLAKQHVADEFDVFAQLSTRNESKPQNDSQSSGAGSIARQRPSAKAPQMMVVLPPPTKPLDRKTSTKPPAPSAEPSAAPSTAPCATSATFDLLFNSPSDLSNTDLFAPSSSATETDGAAFAKPAAARPTVPSKQKPISTFTTQRSKRPAPQRTKRPAPPPPTRKPGSSQSTFYTGQKKEAAISLLDLDFSTPELATSASTCAVPPQPLLILPATDTLKKEAPPSRPPPPRSGEECSAPPVLGGTLPAVGGTLPAVGGTLPPLPPRPGPGHVLYHYILKTGPYCVATFEFEAENDDELDFKAGDAIRLETDLSDEWFAGSIGNRHGIFPKNCVEVKIPLLAPSDSEASVTPTPSPTTIDWTATAAPSQNILSQKDIFNAWGECPRTPSPPPSLAVEARVASPELVGRRSSGARPTAKARAGPHSGATPEPVQSDTRSREESPIDSCTAIYPFEGQEEDELTITEGDVIDVLEFVDDDWIKGKIGDKVGIFPRAYASLEDEDTQDTLEEILDEETHSVNVFYDFEAGADDELSLTAGDMVSILSTVGDEWLKGRCGSREGIFPASFAPTIPDQWNIPEDSETLTENFETTESESSRSSSSGNDTSEVMSEVSEIGERTSDLGHVEVIADFTAENDFEMNVKKGDMVKVTAKLNELWLEGECNGNNGILPINFVKWSSANASSEPDIIGNPAATEDLPEQETLPTLTRQDTIKEDPQQQQSSSSTTPGFSESNPSSSSTTPGFSESNPFAWGAVGAAASLDSGDLPPPPSQEELDKTLVSPDNPFTRDMLAEGTVVDDASPGGNAVKPGDRRRALYAFEPDNADELEFEQGDIIEVTEYLNEDWLKGKCHDKEGLFPMTYTDKLG